MAPLIGDLYTAQDLQPTGSPPSIAQGQSYVDLQFGHRVYCLLLNANIAYAYWTSMNYDNSIILVTAGGNILIYDVIWGPTTATLVNPRSPYDDANNPGQWEGTTWSRTDRNSMIFIRNSTGTAKIIQRNIL